MPDAGESRTIRTWTHAGSGELTASNLAVIIPIEVTRPTGRLAVMRLNAVHLTDEQVIPGGVIERG